MCEVPLIMSLILAEATVTRYPLGGAGDGAVQVTSTVVRPVGLADNSVTAPPPISKYYDENDCTLKII